MCSAICNEFDYQCDLIVFIALRWVFKQLYDRGMVYRGYKVMPYSTACSTPLSNFEAGQNYKDVIDPASECVGTGGEGRGGEGRQVGETIQLRSVFVVVVCQQPDIVVIILCQCSHCQLSTGRRP